jgi:hypothetical protein
VGKPLNKGWLLPVIHRVKLLLFTPKIIFVPVNFKLTICKFWFKHIFTVKRALVLFWYTRFTLPFANLPKILYLSTHQIFLVNNLIPMEIMKKRDRSVEVADLKAVGHFEDELVLFIDSEDPNIPASLCVQANFGARVFDPVQPMAVYLESNSYQRIHDGDRRISYRQRILEEMNPDVIAAMLSDFTQKRLLKMKNDNYPGWEPSWEHPWEG